MSRISVPSSRKKRTKMTVFLFPGQGSQRKGMGNALFDEFTAVVRKVERKAGL